MCSSCFNIKGLFFNNQIGKKKPYLSNIGTENLDILLMRKLQSGFFLPIWLLKNSPLILKQAFELL
jgi:hypothetical protein